MTLYTDKTDLVTAFNNVSANTSRQVLSPLASVMHLQESPDVSLHRCRWDIVPDTWIPNADYSGRNESASILTM